jgi:hypothetical protein
MLGKNYSTFLVVIYFFELIILLLKQNIIIMIRRLFEKLKLIKLRQLHLPQTNVSGSASRKPNPYQLVWYNTKWSKKRTEKNNAKYWKFEIEHNGLRLP